MNAAVLVTMALAAQGVDTDRFAVVVGYNDSPQRDSLRFADDDAARFYELFSGSTTTYLHASFDDESLRLYPDIAKAAKPPTRKSLKQTLRWVAADIERAKEAGRRTELYFFYAGHGDVDAGRHYVTLSDGRLYKDEIDTMVIDEPGADTIHFIVDSCKSFFLVAGRGPGGRRVPYRSAEDWSELRSNVGYVLSTSADAESHEWEALSGGIFSHEVRSGLLGGADTDGDGAVAYDEIATFVAAANSSVPIAKYRPEIFVRGPAADGAVPLFEPSALKDATRLEISAAETGRLSIVDHRGLRYADANKTAGWRMSVALLSPGPYEVEHGGIFYRVRSSTIAVELATAERLDETVLAARGPALAHEAYTELFGEGFGPAIVTGYRLGAREPPIRAESVPPSPATKYALIGGGSAALIGGAVFQLLAAHQIAGADGLPHEEFDIRMDRATTYETTGWVAFGAGIAALTTALILELTE